MADNFETVVKNYSGLSSETKPTLAAGYNIPNGSRWREIDTKRVFHFNLADDAWYETGREIPDIANASPIVDMRALDLLEQILITLKKIEYHLMIASDTELKDQDV